MDTNYREIFDNSSYRLSDIEKVFGISSSQMCGYLYRGVKPNSKTKIKLEMIMNEIQKSQKYIKHPSFGYATEAEICALKNMGIGPDRDLILKRIEKRTKAKGKGIE